MVKREYIEWCDIWVTGASEAKSPRALLIGDSIARSYFGEVERLLAGRFLCARLTTSKCVCDPFFGRELELLLDEYRFAVVHFNNGLHGWEYDEDAYRRSLPGAWDVIAARSGGGALIWAHSTPVRKARDLAVIDPNTERVRARNSIAAEIAAARGIPIDDLFAPMHDHPEYYSDDGVHFNAAGQAVLGAQVSRSILAATGDGT